MPQAVPIVQGHALVETALGWIGIAWTDIGLKRLQLPGSGAADTRVRLLRGLSDVGQSAPPTFVIELRTALAEYARGGSLDFSHIPVDLAGIDDFRLAIYAAARTLAYGQTTTYGRLAAIAGFPDLARETGQALGSNPVPIVIPCHRIVAAAGKLGGFSAPGGAATKRKLLAMERARPAEPASGQAIFRF